MFLKKNEFELFLDKIKEYQLNGIPDSTPDIEFGNFLNEAFCFYLRRFHNLKKEEIHSKLFRKSLSESFRQINFSFYDFDPSCGNK